MNLLHVRSCRYKTALVDWHAVPDLTDKFPMRNCSNREPCSERPAPLSIVTVHSHPKRYVF